MPAISLRSPLRLHPILVIARRHLISLLGNPLGYVFIIAFVMACSAVLFLPDLYYRRDIADLDPLHAWMPVFLAVLLPALAMGAWAGERESGTEELLLTMPITIAEAVLGKYLAILAYFLLALGCSGSNVLALEWIGSPDRGLLAANFLGWLMIGSMFASVSLVASVLVAWPVAAFIIGLVACSTLSSILQHVDFLTPFDLGRMPLAQVLVALAVAAGGICVAILLLSSRRWRPGSHRRVAWQVATLVAALLLCANFARLGAKHGADTDLTSGGLTSLQVETLDLVAKLEQPLTLTAYVSNRLPEPIKPRARALLAKLEALRRAAPERIRVEVRRVESTTDDAAAEASSEYAIEPRQVPSDEVTGRELIPVFLGVGAANAERVQALSYLSPGLSVEYELATLVRSVGLRRKPVLGIADGDFLLLEGSVPTIGGRRPDEQIIQEWRKQWNVVRIDLGRPVPEDVQVLVVPQVSSFTQGEVERLHAYLWEGRPALLFQDPMPVFELYRKRRDLLPDMPRRHPNNLENVEAPKASDLTPLWRSLGLNVEPFAVFWSDYSPSHKLREMTPKPGIWTNAEQGGVLPHPATAGIHQVTMHYAGVIRPGSDTTAATGLVLEPLVRLVPSTSWGLTSARHLTERSPLGGSVSVLDPRKMEYKVAPPDEPLPAMAVAVSGTMRSAWPITRSDGTIVAPGTPSTRPLRAVVVADLDGLNDEFIKLYQGSDDPSVQVPPEMTSLNNVQLAGNLLDWLADDLVLVPLRTARPALRPLTRLQDLMLAAREEQRRTVEAAENRTKDIEDRIVADLKRELVAVHARTDLDQEAMEEEEQRLAAMARSVSEDRARGVKQQLDREIGAAKERQRTAVNEARDQVRALSIGVPAILLALLAMAVALRRRLTERARIPVSRLRGTP